MNNLHEPAVHSVSISKMSNDFDITVMQVKIHPVEVYEEDHFEARLNTKRLRKDRIIHLQKDFIEKNKIDTSRLYLCAFTVHNDYPDYTNMISINLAYNEFPEDKDFQFALYMNPDILIYEDPDENLLVEKIKNEYGEHWDKNLLALMRYHQLKRSDCVIPSKYDFTQWLKLVVKASKSEGNDLIISRNTFEMEKLIEKYLQFEMAVSSYLENNFQILAGNMLKVEIFNSIANIYVVRNQPDSKVELLESGIDIINCTKVQI